MPPNFMSSSELKSLEENTAFTLAKPWGERSVDRTLSRTWDRSDAMCVSTMPVQSDLSSFVMAAKLMRVADVKGNPFMLLNTKRKLLGSFVEGSSPKCVQVVLICS